MQLQILLNLLVAFLWMFFHNSWTVSMFVLGYAVGLILLFLMRRFLAGPFYFVKVIAIVKLVLIFSRELMLSSLFVLRKVLQPRMNIKPGIVAIPTQLSKDWEITLLACLITLTPGTLTMEVSPDRDVLYVHSMDISDTEEVIEQIKSTFESVIMEVSR